MACQHVEFVDRFTKGILQNPAVYWKHLQDSRRPLRKGRSTPSRASPRRSPERADRTRLAVDRFVYNLRPR